MELESFNNKAKHSESADLLGWDRSLPPYCPQSWSTKFFRSLTIYIYLQQKSARLSFVFFLKTTRWISLKLRNSLLSTALWNIMCKLNLLLRRFIYKMKILSKFNCFRSNSWPLYCSFFCACLPKQLRKVHHPGSATLCKTYCCSVLFIWNRTISTVSHGVCLFSGSNFKHWSAPFSASQSSPYANKPHLSSQSVMLVCYRDRWRRE